MVVSTDSEEEDFPAHRMSVACLRRMPSYLTMLKRLQEEGRQHISSNVLAEVHDLEPVIVRKDLAVTGIIGTPRLGFPVGALIQAIEQLLGWDRPTRAVLVGCGNLGSALLGHDRFRTMGLEILGAFDSDPAKAGATIHGLRVQPMEALAGFVAAHSILVGLLATPARAAQDAATAMVQAGIRGIWNFAPAKLRVPEGIVVQKEDMAEGLAVLAHRLYHGAAARSAAL